MIKKLLMGLILGMGITVTSVFGYASITYVMNKTVDQNVTVGETALYTDGLEISLASYDTYTLTYFTLDENDTSKHYITYTYNYTILVDGMDIEVSSIGNDIVVSGLTYTDTSIAITFSLNQEKEFSNGDVLNIQFYFEAVDYSVVNVNDTNIRALVSIGFTETESVDILAYNGIFTNLADIYINIDISDALTRFEPLVANGTIVFE